MNRLTIASLNRACYDHINERDVASLKVECAKSGTRGNMLRRAQKRYLRAVNAAPAFGLIGVGAISFAETRLNVWARRVGFAL